MSSKVSFYTNYYESIYNNILYNHSNESFTLLSINQHYFNPLLDFSHIIKKKNIIIYILFNSENNDFYNEIRDNIKGSECEKNINLITDIDVITNIKFDIVSIFHLYSLDKLRESLNYLKNVTVDKSSIYIYSSLSNEKKDKIYYKNIIRNKILDFTNTKVGTLLSFSDVLETIQEHNIFNVENFNIFKKNNYFLYGNNTVYKLFLKLK